MNLAKLIKARNALNAKIAAIKKAELVKAIEVGAVVTIKDHINDIKGNWVENRHTDCYYNTYDRTEFKVLKVNKAGGTATIKNRIAGTHTVRFNAIKDVVHKEPAKPFNVLTPAIKIEDRDY
jgi:hypothetical protein